MKEADHRTCACTASRITLDARSTARARRNPSKASNKTHTRPHARTHTRPHACYHDWQDCEQRHAAARREYYTPSPRSCKGNRQQELRFTFLSTRRSPKTASLHSLYRSFRVQCAAPKASNTRAQLSLRTSSGVDQAARKVVKKSSLLSLYIVPLRVLNCLQGLQHSVSASLHHSLGVH